MSCLLPLIAGICLADPATFEISLDASERIAGDFTYYSDRQGRHASFGGGNLFTGQISLTAQLSSGFELHYGLRHESLWDHRDSANRRAFVGVTWRPFN